MTGLIMVWEDFTNAPEYADLAADNMGKHKVPTLRNVDKRPGNGFTKAYMHNGVFKSLKEVVHFYNTRDVEMWPDPEVPVNVNTDELGNLGLTDEEEDAIVAFMKTLSDGYTLSKSSLVQTIETNDEVTLDISGLNPFSYKTSLTYRIPEFSYVEIAVYNLAGKKIQSITSEPHAVGEYQFELLADQLGSGIFIVNLQSGNQSVSKKLTIIK
ncbi:MAG: T9SS type A sorting domain-containing protein [Bacteroidales bacterium]